ncbi:hypothetical protein [Alkalicoccus daliensis]|uniref:DUF4181 domain-containing protein n=1 Tax=Alkalicoccus daliensis TaxID=745820 RepID=A0A1G9ZB04_9BACI|nr:hypothetical protein [Alkalicoccus daliensis]SDN18267.1 hypothetical protein SAMN04488053_10121 [Alkalicoccus daliensis]
MEIILLILIILGIIKSIFLLQSSLVKKLGLQEAGWKDFKENGGILYKLSWYAALGLLILILLLWGMGQELIYVVTVYYFIYISTKMLYDWKKSEEPLRAAVTLITSGAGLGGIFMFGWIVYLML